MNAMTPVEYERLAAQLDTHLPEESLPAAEDVPPWPEPLEIKTDTRSLVVNPARDAVVDGTAYVRVTLESVAKPPTFAPWMSDRLRAVSWFGDEKNQILKVVTFTALEWLKGAKTKITGDTGEKDAQEDLAALNQGDASALNPHHRSIQFAW